LVLKVWENCLVTAGDRLPPHDNLWDIICPLLTWW